MASGKTWSEVLVTVIRVSPRRVGSERGDDSRHLFLWVLHGTRANNKVTQWVCE